MGPNHKIAIACCAYHVKESEKKKLLKDHFIPLSKR
jgi:hypothetical protein